MHPPSTAFSATSTSTSTSRPRRTHRKRMSALRLSSDTTTTLPEYIPAAWLHTPKIQREAEAARGRREAQKEAHGVQEEGEEEEEEDRPPDYPDSAEEADEDTDSDSPGRLEFVPQFSTPAPTPLPTSPKRVRRFVPSGGSLSSAPVHRRRQSNSSSSNDSPYLDSLLARSVHALEMSNTLLQSSISTQTSLSAILASDYHSAADQTLEVSARGLSSRIRDHRDVQAGWADDLDEIRRGVEGLFSQEEETGREDGRRRLSGRVARLSTEGLVSSSLPTSSSPTQMFQHRSRRRPSLDLREASEIDAPHLHLSPHNRARLVSPPPRALTQYIASTADPGSVALPSTGPRAASASSHFVSDRPPLPETSASSSYAQLHAAPSSPRLTDKPLVPSTPAYTMLSTFVYRTPGTHTPPPTASRTSFMSRQKRGSRNTSPATSTASTPSITARKSPDGRRSEPPGPILTSSGGTHSATHASKPIINPNPLLPHRPMTPTTEESSSSDGCPAKLTIVSLRKILDDQPPLTPPVLQLNGDSLKPDQQQQQRRGRARPPAFMPRTPAPAAEAGTSTATASISRLFTKATHSSSTRPPSPPRQSAMKHSASSSLSNTPSPSPTTLSIPDMVFGPGVRESGDGSGSGGSSGSGRSTPKRISFAELPESYASSRPGGSSFRKRRGKGKHVKSGSEDGEVEGAGGKWWSTWLLGAAAAGAGGPVVGGPGSPGGYGVGKHEERMEDRMSRTWGGRMGPGFGSGMDEWAV